MRMVANGTSRQIPKARIYCGIDAKQTFVDERIQPNLPVENDPEAVISATPDRRTAFLFSDPLLTPTLTAVW